MISQEEIEKALKYLATSSQDLAKWRSRRVWLEEKSKTVRAYCFRSAEGTVAEREAQARTDEDYQAVLEDIREAVYEETLIKGYRDAAEAKIEIYRTQQASMRASNI